ncbi:hypothetical protein [Sphingopyxis indica]|nr:hypothetical protein [Sphingopyxis indica]
MAIIEDSRILMMKALIVGIAALTLVPVSAVAMEPAASDSAQKDDASKDGDQNRVICKREKIIGSRLGSKKTCATEAEWAQMRAEQRQATERVQANRPRQN